MVMGADFDPIDLFGGPMGSAGADLGAAFADVFAGCFADAAAWA